MAPISDEVKGGDWHHDNPHDEVRHGEAHDEHVGHRLEPPLGPGDKIDQSPDSEKDRVFIRNHVI